MTCVESYVLLHRLQIKWFHQLIPGLLKSGKGTGPEEHDGVSEPVPLAVKADLVHQCIRCNLVVRRAVHFSSSQDSVPESSLLSKSVGIACSE